MLLSVVTTTTSLGARAGQGAPAPTAAEREEAKRLYTEGRKLAADGKMADAIDRFRRAHDLAPTPVTRLELAKTLLSQGLLLEAHGLLVTVPALPVTKTETQKSTLAREEAKTLAPTVAAKIPRLTIEVTPAGEQEVTVDGKAVSKELLGDLGVDPGEHTVVAKRGALETKTTVTVAEGDKRTVTLAFVVEAPPDPLPLPEEHRTPPPLGLPPEDKVGSPPPEPKPEEPAPEGITPVVPIAFGTAGVGLLTGLITGSIALSQAGDLKDQCKGGFCPPASHSLLATHEALATTSTIAFSLGGAAAAVGAIAWIVDATTSNDKNAARIGVRWAGTGVAIEGAW